MCISSENVLFLIFKLEREIGISPVWKNETFRSFSCAFDCCHRIKQVQKHSLMSKIAVCFLAWAKNIRRHNIQIMASGVKV